MPDQGRQQATTGRRERARASSALLSRLRPRIAWLCPIGDGSGAAAIRCRYSPVLSRCEEVAVVPVERQKPLFGRRMRLDCAVEQNMTDSQFAFRQRPRHQKTAVAVERIALRAHQADAASRWSVRDSAPHRRPVVRDPPGIRPAAPSPHSRQSRRNKARGFADGRPAWRRMADRSCPPASTGRREFAGEPGTKTRHRRRAHVGNRAHAG